MSQTPKDESSVTNTAPLSDTSYKFQGVTIKGASHGLSHWVANITRDSRTAEMLRMKYTSKPIAVLLLGASFSRTACTELPESTGHTRYDVANTQTPLVNHGHW